MDGCPSLRDFNATFPDNDACWTFLRNARWGEDQFECPRCGETEHWGFIQPRKLFQCNACGRQTSITAGTVMQDTKLDLHTWFQAAYLILTTKKSITSPELARKLGVGQDTAWFLMHRIHKALDQDNAPLLDGLVEADEAYLGGKDPVGRRNTDKKHLIVALAERREDEVGQIRLLNLPDASRETLHAAIAEHVTPGATVRTDGWTAYKELENHEHEVRLRPPDRAGHKVLPAVHMLFTNLRRVVHGVHTHASKDRVQEFLDGFAHRFNHRKDLGAGLVLGLSSLVASSPWPYRAGAR